MRARAAAAAAVILAMLCAPCRAQSRVEPADDEAVRQLWLQLTQSSAATDATAPPASPWHGQAAVQPTSGEGLWVGVRADVRQVRSNAPALLTPLRRGRAHAIELAWDGLHNDADGVQVWASGHWLTSDDRALLAQRRHLLGSFQVGRADATHYLALGDVQPAWSALGTTLGLRGVLAQRAGQAGVLSVAAGTVAQTWADGGSQTLRARELRDIAALKYEHWLNPAATLFVTWQAQADRRGSAGAAAAVDGSLRARTVSLGATWQAAVGPGSSAVASAGATGVARGWARAEAEWARSRASRRGATLDEPVERGTAAVLRAQWQGDDWALRGGWQRSDPAFTTPSVLTMGGQREAWLGGEWRPHPAALVRAEWREAGWLVGDLQQDAPERGLERRSRSLTLGAQSNLAGWIDGLSAEASLREARSTQPAGLLLAGSRGEQRWQRLGLAWARAGWNVHGSVSRQTLHDTVFAPEGALQQMATLQMAAPLAGWRVPALGLGAEGGWVSLMLSRQRQDWRSRGGSELRQAQLLVGQQGLAGWSASGSLGRTWLQAQSGAGFALVTGSLQLRAAWGARGWAELFWRADLSEAPPGLESSSVRQFGVQVGRGF